MNPQIRLWLLVGLAAPAWAQDVDTDGDGVPDAGDKCPSSAEDRNGYQDEDGCPDERIRKLLEIRPDQDGDGVPDADDRCPLVPETKNGVKDEDGCPESLYDSLTFQKADPASTPSTPKAPVKQATPPQVPPDPGRGSSAASGTPDRAPGVQGDPICRGQIDGSWESLAQVGPTPVIRCDDGRRIQAYNSPSIPNGTRGLLYCWKDKAEPQCDLRIFYVDAGTSYHGTGCFFTTAVARVRGEADDGPTLTALRAFRDSYLAGHPDVPAYYRIAPPIVAFIQAHPQAEAIWRAVDQGWIRPILADIGAGRPERAHSRYRHLVRTLAGVRSASETAGR
jgi:hypothetical protein